MNIVTPERWYMAFWLCMAAGVILVNGLVTGAVVYLALKWAK